MALLARKVPNLARYAVDRQEHACHVGDTCKERAMINRTGLLIATGLTAFVLVGFGFATVPSRSAAADQTPSVSQPLSPEREAVYQQTLAEATVKLEQANAQIAAANVRLSQPNQSAAPASPASPDAPAYAITAGQAEAAALQAYPHATLTRTSEVVDYQGTLAHEVTLDRGTLYIDAQTGELLYDGVVAQQPQRGEPHAEDDEQNADERADAGNHEDQD